VANNEEYRDYDDIYSARSENTNTSIRDAKRNRVLLDNNMNWYIFENNLLMGLDYLDKYKNTIFQMVTKVRIGNEYFMRPEYVSYSLYGTTDLWYLLLWLNDMKNPNEFIKNEIYVVAANKMSELQKVLDRARSYVYNVYNPKPIQKHYIKHPKLPSTKLLPDSYNEKIYDCGFVTYQDLNFLDNMFYVHNPNEYYHGKSKMIETKENVFTNSYKELSLRYMDGIQISNTTYDPIFDNTGEIREYKFTGYMYFPYSGIYDFQFNGINGSAYLIVGNDYCTSSNNETIIKLSEVDKKFDFFELKTKNSDFKKRNWNGWTYHNDKLRLLTDINKRKPVAKTIINNDFFDDAHNIVTNPDRDNIIEKIYTDGETNFITYKTESHNLLFYNKMYAEDLNIDLEPYNNGNDGKIVFTCEMLAIDVSNVEIQPYIKINYTDGSSENSILNHYNIGALWTTNEYETLIVSINKDKDKKVSTVEFGIFCEKRNIYDDCHADLSINQVSINLTEFDIVSCVIDENNKGKWLPFVCSYKYNGNILKVFYIKRRMRIKIDSGRYIIDKEKNIISSKASNKIIYKIGMSDDENKKYTFRRNWLKIFNDEIDKNELENPKNTLEDLIHNENKDIIVLKSGDIDFHDDTFYLISPYEYIARDQIAIVPFAGENSFNESVLVTISDKYNREACFLQHNINKEVIVYSEEESTVSFKTCLLIENNKSKYKLQLEQEEDVEIYLDNNITPLIKGTGSVFYFTPINNNTNEMEIKNKGYRLGNLEIYIKNTKNKNIKVKLSMSERNVFQELNDDFFIVRPQHLFTYSNLSFNCINLEDDIGIINSEDIESNKFNLHNLLLEENHKKDTITIDNNVYKKQLSVFKPGIITFEEKISNRECTNYVLEFDISINSDQNGQFIINLDRQTDGKKYSMLFNYKTSYSDNPIFELHNGLYTNTSNTLKELSNIDRGIDFYKHKYEEVPIYKNVLSANHFKSLKKFVIYKNTKHHIKIKKKKNFISLQIDDEYVAIWHDYEKVYINGLCGFTFINLNSVSISDLNLYC